MTMCVLDAPRWRINGGLDVALEETAAPELRAGLAALGHRIGPGDAWGFGCGQFVVRLDDGYAAGSDPRGDGYPVGF